MSFIFTPTKLLGLIATGIAALLVLSFSAPVFAETDSAVIEALMRQNGCMKCHAIDRKKQGPSYREVAAKYKGKAGAEARLITHITTGEKAKLENGQEEAHVIIKTKDTNEIKSIVNWILAL
ncbi:MAG: c-type cytochrome [Polaromonas sp.]|nr:c-type cytochrome [Polaromonas sp.]